MGWGVLMGLGQGLQNFSNQMQEINKTKLLEQLEIEKENRQEARDIAREQRAQQQFSGEYRYDWENGVKYRLNKNGEPMGEPIMLTAEEKRQKEISDETASLDLSLKRLGVNKGEIDLENSRFERDTAERRLTLEERLRNAQIEELNSRAANHGRSRTAASDRPLSNEELATTLLNEYKSLVEQYAKSESNPNGLTPDEFLEFAAASVRKAQQRQQNARTIFRTGLKDYFERIQKARGQ